MNMNRYPKLGRNLKKAYDIYSNIYYNRRIKQIGDYAKGRKLLRVFLFPEK